MKILSEQRSGFIMIVLLCQIDEKEARRFDDSLEKMEKKFQPSQEEFFILSNSTINKDSSLK